MHPPPMITMSEECFTERVRGSGVQGSRFVLVRGSGFGVRGSAFGVRRSTFEVRGSTFEVRGSRFEVRRSRFTVPRRGANRAGREHGVARNYRELGCWRLANDLKRGV